MPNRADGTSYDVAVVCMRCGASAQYTRAEWERESAGRQSWQPRYCDACDLKSRPTKREPAMSGAERESRRRREYGRIDDSDWKRQLVEVRKQW